MNKPDQEDASKEVHPRAHGLGASRLAQLRSDLLLTPEERVRAAEATLNVDRLREPNVSRRVIGFDRYEDYLDYKFNANVRATAFQVEGVRIPTASIEDLIASKQTGRLQDAADIEVLEEIRRLRNP